VIGRPCVRSPKTRNALTMLAPLLAMACTFAQSAGKEAPDPRPGVNTHFSQGWPLRYIDSAAALGTATIRDSLHWAKIETAPGQYFFTEQNSAHIASSCAAGMKVLLVIEPRNPLYDSGQSAYSPASQNAFASSLAAIAARYRGCVAAIQIGNEINGRNNVTGLAAANRVAWYMSLLKAVNAKMRPAHPDVKIIGGSTNIVATGFLEQLFAAGMLSYVDAVAVHPYRPDPEGVDWELARLRAAIVRHGPVKPVWATEFSRDFTSPADAPAFYLKMSALMQGAGVSRHFWYALLDQKWFPSMGLLTTPGARKPVADAYAFAAAKLAPLGPAVRIDHGDPTIYHFRYGNAFDLVWGAPRGLTVTGPAVFHRADGSIAPQATALGNDPILIEGGTSIGFGPADVVADSFHGFAQEPLRWFGRRDLTGAEYPLLPVDWRWATYLGNAAMRSMIVTQNGVGTAGRTSAVVRYVVTQSGAFHASACLVPLGTTGDGVIAAIRHNGTIAWTARAGPLAGQATGAATVNASRGDAIELVVSPGASPRGDRMRYRFRIGRSARNPATC